MEIDGKSAYSRWMRNQIKLFSKMNKYSSRNKVNVKNILLPGLHCSPYGPNAWETDKINTVILKPDLSTVFSKTDFHRLCLKIQRYRHTDTHTHRHIHMYKQVYTHRYTNEYTYTSMHTYRKRKNILDLKINA